MILCFDYRQWTLEQLIDVSTVQVSDTELSERKIQDLKKNSSQNVVEPWPYWPYR